MAVMQQRLTIPIFFAVDDNYAPFLVVSLTSMLKNACDINFYKIHILTTNLSLDWQKKIQECIILYKDFTSVEFIDLKARFSNLFEIFHTRDYYTKETYDRFFISDSFSQYDKVIYTDCDMIFLDDVAKLYKIDLGDNLVAAAPEEVMAEVEVFGNYVEKALGCDRYKFFNAGLMVINARLFRQEGIIRQFLDMIKQYKFRVTQDEDYLNVLCKGRAVMLDLGWNKTAFKNSSFNDSDLKIIHYKIHWKPWHYAGVAYEDYFWQYAKQTPLYKMLKQMRDNYTQEQKAIDEEAYKNLMYMAQIDAKDPENYFNKNQAGLIERLVRAFNSFSFSAVLEYWSKTFPHIAKANQ